VCLVSRVGAIIRRKHQNAMRRAFFSLGYGVRDTAFDLGLHQPLSAPAFPDVSSATLATCARRPILFRPRGVAPKTNN